MTQEKIFYKVSELTKMGFPKERLLELCRAGKIGRKSNPTAERGYHYLIRLEEAERVWR